jgi:2-methylisocitrate lyase-like PEP mutase family enzyme
MDRDTQTRLAADFRARHEQGPMVVLPNAFDVATARLIARHAPVIGTTSGGIAAMLGFPDGELVGRDAMLEVIERMAASVDVGITADVEAGYGDAVDDARRTARRLVDIGAIGLNLQDTGHPKGEWSGGLLPIERASEKIAAVRAVADEWGVPLVVNARTDTFLADGDPVAEAIRRGNAYLAAGADCVFAPGIRDATGIATLVEGLDGPLNVYAVPGTPEVAELDRLGVRRVSVGCGPYQACLALVERATRELLERGTYSAFLDRQMPYGEMLELLADGDRALL